MGGRVPNLARTLILALCVSVTVAGCGRFSNPFSGSGSSGSAEAANRPPAMPVKRQSKLFDLFANNSDPNTTVEVNKYLWNAALDVLNFMPVQSADPFSGIIVMGYGTPPGGRTAYRATVFIRDPALEARSINVALATRAGPASAETVRAVEDAIMTRARQLRMRDLKL